MRPVLLVVPTRGQIDHRTITLLQAERDLNPEIPPIEFVSGGLAVSDVRHKAIRLFLETDAEVLVMVDDDIGPPPGFVEAMVNEIDEECHIIGLPTMIAQIQANIPFPTVYRWQDAEPDSADLENPEPFVGGYRTITNPFARTGLVECDGVGSAT
ncbi:MAG: hypothetical protein ACHQNA_14890, partial [Acidimicrobiales bacterium]